MSKIIGVFCTKCGTTKTRATANLAAQLRAKHFGRPLDYKPTPAMVVFFCGKHKLPKVPKKTEQERSKPFRSR